MANIIPLKDDTGAQFYPQTHEKAVVDSNGVTLASKLANISAPSYVVAWDGNSTPVVANIPAGVTFTYSGNTYTGTLAASSSTVNKTYLVGDNNGNFDEYVTQVNGSTYSWVYLGNTEIDLSDYATKDDLNQLDQELNGVIFQGSVTGPGQNSAYFPVTPGTTYKITAEAATINAQIYFYSAIGQGNIGYSNLVRGENQVTAPTGAYFARFYTTSANQTTIYFTVVAPGSILGEIEKLGEDVDENADAIAALRAETVGEEVDASFTSLEKFIDSSGYLSVSENFNHSSPIHLEAGQSIIVNARGYSTNVSMIAKYNGEGQRYTPLVISVDNTTREYRYTASEDVSVAVSYNINFPYSVKVFTPSGLSQAEKRVDTLYLDMAVAGIPVVGIVGDSLSCGVSAKQDSSWSTNPDLAWWQVLKRDSGADYKYFAEGGCTTRSWFSASQGATKAFTAGNECCAYVIALGVNDQWELGVDYIGAITDIKDNYVNNADTFYGNYGKIIQMLTERVPNAKFFLLTIPRTTGVYPNFNEAIRAIAAKFSNCYLVDLASDYLDDFQSGYIKANEYGGAHYSSSGYQCIGKVMEKAISEVMVKNAADFLYVQFALDSVSN